MILDPSIEELLRVTSADLRRHAMIHIGSGNFKAAQSAQDQADRLDQAISVNSELLKGLKSGAYSDHT